jgi:mannose-6-phosphate isomerase-like protein (cupin superfamily)
MKSNAQNYTEQRPWGQFENLLEADHAKVKLLTVEPGKRLSLQSHDRREEVWVVVKGVATVQIDDNEITADSSHPAIFIPRGSKHRLSNLGTVPVEIIEVQRGQYFGEDDIHRYQDDHGRV